MSRPVEISLGLFAAFLGFIGLGFAVFGPATYSYGTNWLTAGSVSLWDQGIGTTNVLIFLAVMIVAALSIGVGAYLRGAGGGYDALGLLWVGFILLLAGAVITLPGSTTAVVPSALHTSTPDSAGIGVYLLPAAFVAFIAAIIGAAAHFEPYRTMLMRPH
jgi:hypothetical protein